MRNSLLVLKYKNNNNNKKQTNKKTQPNKKSLKATTKDIPQSSHSQTKREGSKTFATKQEDQAVVFVQGSQGGGVKPSAKITASSLCMAFPDPPVLGVLGQHSDPSAFNKGKTKQTETQKEGKKRRVWVSDLLFPSLLCL